MITIDQIKDKFKGALIVGITEAKKNSEGKYMSHRNDEEITLVCQKLDRLTVEDYDKWYSLYYLMKEPSTNDVYLISLTHGTILDGIDHEYYPNTVIEFCKENNIIIDEASYIAICRSFMEYTNYDYHTINKQMPHKLHVLQYTETDCNAVCKTYYVSSIYDSAYLYAL